MRRPPVNREKVTIAVVAKQAGVSKGLVSFALNDRPGVAAETRARILQVATELGWKPSLRARSLSTQRSFALGFVIARNPDVLASDPFFTSFIAGVESILTDQGRTLVLSVVPDEAREVKTYRSLVADGRVDGVFLSDLRHNDPRIPLLSELGLPAVTLGRPDGDSPFPAVSVDDSPGITASVAHLVTLGHRRIAHVAGNSALLHGSRRREAFAAALRDAGLPEGQTVETDFSMADGSDATRRLLTQDRPPTAIVFANDPMAIAGLGVAHELGIRVPEDLSITGYDDIDFSRYVYPPLTTVSAAPMVWGRAAATTLLALMENGTADDVDLPAARLVIRGSTAPPLNPW
ncbi:LacI family transcriptional regulator [Cryobacterium sp. TmT2-59]|uniref:LacI family transcriptional regulator n=1 Tax=Cryobacterium shii TaxID=1259235 RepID=A0AAQ2C8S9_9MICO|nr:LacI family transcriptional regulator [Cryobacterium shii]TFC84637.1 LacI family transcriptional regulator [Cryobacterium sp. TmT2-59]TFD16230.1 LacI family transcriptional regulator [Cryobacterium sp. TMT2-23]